MKIFKDILCKKNMAKKTNKVNLKKLLEHWGITSINMNAYGFGIGLDFKPTSEDLDAAWELYIELITRITTQKLEEGFGDEKAALNSIYSLFDITRNVLKEKGRKCVEFSKIAIILLNGELRPFTTKWHVLLSDESSLSSSDKQEEQFRKELYVLQRNLRKYTLMLSRIAQVPDLTDIETLLDKEFISKLYREADGRGEGNEY